MAKTIGTSWTNIASYNWQPGTGFNITFYLDARYDNTKKNIEKNESYIYTRQRSVIHSGYGSGYNYYFWCDHTNVVSGTDLWTFANEIINESGKITIPHNADGTKTIRINAGGRVNGVGLNFSMGEDVVLETIPRTTKLTDKTGTIGEELNITWSKASSSFRHKLVYSFGDIENEVLGENLVDNFTWTPSTDLYQYIKDKSSGEGTLTLTTYSGTTVIGSSTAKLTLNVKDDETTKPIIENALLFDGNEYTKSLTGDNQTLIIGQSTAVLGLNFKTQEYASVVSLKINGVEQPFEVTQYDTYQTGVASITYEKVTTNTFNIVITDSRGFTNEGYIITNDKIDYIDLDCLPTFKRIQPTTGEVGLSFEGKYFNNTFGEVNNSLKVSYAYKIKEDEDYSDEVLLVRDVDYKIIDNTFHSGDSSYKSEINLGEIFDYKKVYNFVLYVEDALTRLVINALVVKGIPIFWWNGEKVTINGDLYLADEDGNNPINVKNLVGGGGYDSLPVGSIISFDGDEVPVGYEEVEPNYIVATINAVYTTAENVRIILNTVAESSGTKLTLENGAIKIGEGVSKIRVSASAFINNWAASTNYAWLKIRKNESNIAGVINSATASFISTSIPTTIISVTSGDEIDLAFEGPTSKLRNGRENTWLCVEVIE